MKIVRNILTYFFVVTVIYNCYSLMSLVRPHAIFYIAAMVEVLLILCTYERLEINKTMMVVMAVYVVCLLILCTSSYFRNFEFVASCVVFFVPCAFYLCQPDAFKDFFLAFTNVVTVIAIISLVFYVFASLLQMIPETNQYTSDQHGWGSDTFRNFMFIYNDGQKATALGYKGLRNIAIFVEGPMLTYVFIFALYQELFLRKKKLRIWVVIILAVTIITSFSTTGIVMALVLIFIRFYKQLMKIKLFKYLILPVMVIVVAFLAYYVLADKFSSNTFSSSARTDDILTGLKTFLSSPLNGVGYNNTDAFDAFRTFAHTGISTGIGAIMAFGGILWSFWFIAPFVFAVCHFIKYKDQRKEMGFIIVATVLLLVTVTQSRLLCTFACCSSWMFVVKNTKFSFYFEKETGWIQNERNSEKRIGNFK